MTDIEAPFGTYANKTHWKVRFRPLLKHKAIPGVIRRYIKTYPRNLISDVEVEGIKFRCYPAQSGHDKLFFLGTIFDDECEELAFMLEKAANAECVVDIGANTGTIAIPVALKAKGLKRLLAIEPDAEHLSRLRYNITLNNASNISVVPCAVSGEVGVMRLWHNKRNLEQHSLHPMFPGQKTFTEVPVRPLLDILAENGVKRVDLLKIDIEGFEDRALMPFFRKADRALWPRAISFEHVAASWWAEDVAAFMLSNGYSLVHKTGYNTMMVFQEP